MADLDLIVRGGTLVTATSVSRVDVGLADGRVTALEEALATSAPDEIDADGLHVFPVGLLTRLAAARRSHLGVTVELFPNRAVVW